MSLGRKFQCINYLLMEDISVFSHRQPVQHSCNERASQCVRSLGRENLNRAFARKFNQKKICLSFTLSLGLMQWIGIVDTEAVFQTTSETSWRRSSQAKRLRRISILLASWLKPTKRRPLLADFILARFIYGSVTYSLKKKRQSLYQISSLKLKDFTYLLSDDIYIYLWISDTNGCLEHRWRDESFEFPAVKEGRNIGRCLCFTHSLSISF